MSKPTLLVLAAGMGSRYGGLKQIDSFGPSGETILDYSVFDAIRAGFGKVVFVIRRTMKDHFDTHIVSKFKDKIQTAYAFQDLYDKIPVELQASVGLPSPTNGHDNPHITTNDSGSVNNDENMRVKPWGTGHAVLVAQDEIATSRFAVINADDFYGLDAFITVAQFLMDKHTITTTTTQDQHCLVGYHVKNTLSERGGVSRGACHVSPAGYLQDITERHGIRRDPESGQVSYNVHLKEDQGGLEGGCRAIMHEDEIVSMNLMGFDPSMFQQAQAGFMMFLQTQAQENRKAEFYLPTIMNQMIIADKQRKIEAASESRKPEKVESTLVKVLSTSSKWFGCTYKEEKELVSAEIRALVDQGVYPVRLWP